MLRDLLVCSDEVREALQEHRPVVALESTIIRHGMPYPQNLEMARTVEAIIRDAGAVPATVAVYGGRCRVGLSDADLQMLATASGVAKASLRDLPILIARGEAGATTVAATATIADAAGIPVFVTGGIGGVHRTSPRSAAQVFDISTDLTVLGRTSIAVVSAGAKSVLDIPATLEVLETLGVTVVGYGTDHFPGFFTRDTSHPVDLRVDTPDAVAEIIVARRTLGLPGGVLIANPPPREVALEDSEVEAHITVALAEMARAGVTGKAVTPYLLARLREMTGGRSQVVNLALIQHNARLGAEIAVALTAHRS